VTAVHIGVLPEATLEQLNPLHEAALGCITFAAGSELVIEQLRANKKLVSWLALSMCGCSFAIVFLLMITLLTAFPASTGASEDARRAPPTHAPDTRAQLPRAALAPARASRARARAHEAAHAPRQGERGGGDALCGRGHRTLALVGHRGGDGAAGGRPLHADHAGRDDGDRCARHPALHRRCQARRDHARPEPNPKPDPEPNPKRTLSLILTLACTCACACACA